MPALAAGGGFPTDEVLLEDCCSLAYRGCHGAQQQLDAAYNHSLLPLPPAAYHRRS